MVKRKKTKVIKIGKVKIGGNFPILVQSMTNTFTSDVGKTVKQIKELKKAGCEIVRVGVPDLKSAQALSRIKKQINIPLVADIHFSANLALEAINQGVDKLRINPGNFPKDKLKEIVKAAKKEGIPIRIGINSGSLEKDILGRKERATAEMMVKSALRNIRLMEKLGFFDLVISLKAPDVLRTVKAYKLLSQKTNYPLHLGVTEAGAEFSGTIKSSVALGSLLLAGIGDTIRISLTGDPIEEVRVGWEILKSLDLREKGVKIVSCPTCARTEIDVIGLSKKIEKITNQIEKPIKIAIMGCLPKGIPIIANPTLKPIEKIEVNDRVLAHSGKFQKVTQIFKRYYHGKLIEIQPRGFPFFSVTPEHPIQAIPRPYLSKSKQRFIAVSRTIGQKNPKWVEAGTLSKAWILTYPIIKGTRDVENYKGIKVDKDFLILSGYYLSEGSLSGRNGKLYQVHFDFHTKEKSLYLNLMQILNKYNIKACTYIRKAKKTFTVYVSSLLFSSLLFKLFSKRAEKKHMPPWFLTLPPKKQVHLLKALWEGDGYIGKVKGYWRASYVTTSLLLAFQVHQLLLRQGIAAYIISKGPRPGHQKSYAVTVTGKYYLNLFFQALGLDIKLSEISQRKQHIIVDSKFLYVPIFKIKKVPYKGIVYNLKVFKDHSYITFGASLHNCIVNGLGEAREADLAIVGIKDAALIIRALAKDEDEGKLRRRQTSSTTKNGKIIKRIAKKNIFKEFKKELKKYR